MSNPELVQYIAEQLSGAGMITYRKMFGEYGVYCDGKIFALICEDKLFIKITDEVKNKYPDLPEAPPYNGGKNYFYIEDIDNREYLTEITVLTCHALPEPKKRKRKNAEI